MGSPGLIATTFNFSFRATRRLELRLLLRRFLKVQRPWRKMLNHFSCAGDLCNGHPAVASQHKKPNNCCWRLHRERMDTYARPFLDEGGVGQIVEACGGVARAGSIEEQQAAHSRLAYRQSG